jgi:hypothetical protein
MKSSRPRAGVETHPSSAGIPTAPHQRLRLDALSFQYTKTNKQYLLSKEDLSGLFKGKAINRKSPEIPGFFYGKVQLPRLETVNTSTGKM